MALAETAKLVVELNASGNLPAVSKKSVTALKKVKKEASETHKALSKIGQGLAKGFKRGAVIGAGAIGLLALNVRAGIDSLAELQDVQNATQQALKTTRSVAGQTAKGIRDLSQALEDQTTIDDKIIQKGANLLLTFTRVRKSAFKPALLAALDLNEALGKGPSGLNSTITLVGKALNDPIKGLSRLERAGVKFTDQQKKQIQVAVDAGDTLKAQKIILQQLNHVYGGRATAAAKGYRGQMRRLGDAVENLQQALAKPLLKPLTKITKALADFANSKDVQNGISDLAKGIADLFTDENIQTVGDDIKSGFQWLKDLPWGAINAGLSVTAGIAAKAVDIFNSLPPEIKGGLITLLAANKLTGGLVASGLKDLAGIALKSLTTITAGNVTVIGASVTNPPPGGVTPPGGVPVGTDPASIVGKIVRGAITGAALGQATELLNSARSGVEAIDALRDKMPLTGAELSRLYKAALSGGKAGVQAEIESIITTSGRTIRVHGGPGGHRGAGTTGDHPAQPPIAPTRSSDYRFNFDTGEYERKRQHGGPGGFRGGPTTGDPMGPLDAIRDILKGALVPGFGNALTVTLPNLLGNVKTAVGEDKASTTAKLAGLQAAQTAQQIATRERLAASIAGAKTQANVDAIGVKTAISTGAAGISTAVRAIPAPKTNVYVNTFVSATAVLTGTARAVATNRARIA